MRNARLKFDFLFSGGVQHRNIYRISPEKEQRGLEKGREGDLKKIQKKMYDKQEVQLSQNLVVSGVKKCISHMSN